MKLILVRGIPGSGKTTFVKNQLKLDNPLHTFHFEADMYFEKYNPFAKKMEYNFDPSKLSIAHKICLEKTQSALRTGAKVYVSNTFTTIKEMEPYVTMARILGAKVEIHEMSEIPVIEGKQQNIHGVPTHVIDKMLRRWAFELPSSWKGIQYTIHSTNNLVS